MLWRRQFKSIGVLALFGAAVLSPEIANAQTAVCGDSVVEAGEQCDDGNTQAFDGCANCRVEICSQGDVQFPNPAYGHCSSQAQCGPTASCVSGACTPSRCSNNCTQCTSDCLDSCVSNLCGDRKLDPFELCDDGNTVDGDGCSSTCSLEGLSPEGWAYCASPDGSVTRDPSRDSCNSDSECGAGSYCDRRACAPSDCYCDLFDGWVCTSDCGSACRVGAEPVPALGGGGAWLLGGLVMFAGMLGSTAAARRRKRA